MRTGVRIIMGVVAGSMLGLGLALLRNSAIRPQSSRKGETAGLVAEPVYEILLEEIIEPVQEPAA